MTDFRPAIGTWWIDSDPDRRVPGYVELDMDAPSFPWRLTIEGQLQEKFEPGVDQTVTIFGETPLGIFTLERAARRETWRGSGPGTMQAWCAARLLRGGHVSREQVFNWASFQLPHLWHWLGPTALNQHAAGLPKMPPLKRGDDTEWIHSELGNGIVLNLGRALNISFDSAGWHENSHESAWYNVTSDEGFTAKELYTIQDGLAKLHSLVTGVLMEPTQIEFGSGEDADIGWSEVPAGPPSGEDWKGIRDPFFDTADVDFSTFVREWVRLHKAAPIVASVIAPRRGNTYVTTLLTDACNGAEALATYRWNSEKGALSSADMAALDVLAAQNVPRKTCKRIEKLLRQDSTLQSKLELLASDLGEESSMWLLGPNVSVWARLVVRLRNSVAHGTVLPNGLSDDMHFVITAYESLSAVLRLAVFKTCGYTNQLSGAGEELLWARGRSVVGHPNSSFYHHTEFLATQSAYWANWERRLDEA